MTPKKDKKTGQKGKPLHIYVKPMDFDIFEWAGDQPRMSLSDVIALALYDYREKIEGKGRSKKKSR
jgi:hypothetical protein